MNTSNRSGSRDDDLRQIRAKIDSDDPFFPGHGIRTGGSRGSRHAARLQSVPPWTKSDEKIRAVLLRVFPKLETNDHQRRRASIWARIIYLYYRSGYTYSEIADEMNLKSVAMNRPFSKIEHILENVRYAAKGLSHHGRRRGSRGRPKKIGV